VKKTLKVIAVLLIVLGVGLYGFLSYNAEKNVAVALPEALAYMESDEKVSVSFDNEWLVMQPANKAPTQGIMFYSGAYCDVRGYSPVLRGMAEAGYLVVGPQMPFYFSIFAPNAADDVRAAYPEIKDWIVMGHSMGGAMAGRYADIHRDDLAGVIFLDGHPPEANDMSDSDLPTLHINRARADGSISQKFEDKKSLYSTDLTWVKVPGGIHMNYGAFGEGPYVEEWEASITPQEQWAITNSALLTHVPEMFAK